MGKTTEFLKKPENELLLLEIIDAKKFAAYNSKTKKSTYYINSAHVSSGFPDNTVSRIMASLYLRALSYCSNEYGTYKHRWFKIDLQAMSEKKQTLKEMLAKE